MFNLMTLLSFFLILSHASNNIRLSYWFYATLGKVFQDGYNNIAVNGISSLNTLNDTLATDRGAYFLSNNTVNLITLAPNNLVSSPLYLSATFSISIWVLSVANYDYYLFYHGVSASDKLHIIKRTTNSCIEAQLINANTGDSGVVTAARNSFTSGMK